MTKIELKEFTDVLDRFGVDYSGDVVYLTSRGNSCIMNPNFKPEKFIGRSINSIAQQVANELNKQVAWEEE